jgi:small-conductance mechanosensitive channel
MLSGCAEKEITNNKINQSALTYADFEKNLKADMDYQTIVAVFGTPVKDVGSGIHIYVYEFNDSTEIWIGYTSKIIYARHVDSNHMILHTLI